MEELKEMGIENVASGAIPEMFKEELAKVLQNIDDPNTDPKAKRAITVEVTFAPAESREMAEVIVKTKSKLVAPRAVGSAVHLTRREGRLAALLPNAEQEAMRFPQVVHGREGRDAE